MAENTGKSKGRVILRPLLALTILLALVGIGYLAYVEQLRFESNIVQAAQSHLLTVARTQAGAIEDALDSIQENLREATEERAIRELIAGHAAIRDAREGHLSSREQILLGHINRGRLDIDALYRLDAKGIIQNRIPFKEDRIGADFSGKPEVAAVIQTHKPIISEAFSSLDKSVSISVCQPIFDDDGAFIGILRAMIYLDALQEMLGAIRTDWKGHIHIIDDGGIMMAHPQKDQIGTSVVGNRREAYPDLDWSEMEQIVKRMGDGVEGVGIYHSVRWDQADTTLAKNLTAFAPIRLGNELWSLGMVMDYDEIAAPIKEHQRNVAGATLMMGAIFLVAAFGMHHSRNEALRLRILGDSNRQITTERNKLEAIVGAIDCGLTIQDTNYAVVFQNEILKTIYGDGVGQTCYRVYERSDTICADCPVRQVYADGMSHSVERAIRRPSGAVRYLELNASPIRDADGAITGCLELVRDITQRKIDEDTLRDAVGRAETASRIKSEFLANMSHEIRTPMNAIIGFSDLLEGEPLTAEQAEYVGMISKSSQHLMELINDILDISKIESREETIYPDTCELGPILDDVEAMMVPQTNAKGLRFSVCRREGLPEKIVTDAGRLRQCLLNLTSNAVKFTEAGSVCLTVRPAFEDGGVKLVFEVADTGIGVSADKQAAIFEAFVQADNSSTRRHAGTGLGLTITKRLVEKMGGYVTLESAEGVGSTFTLVLPVDCSARPDISVPLAEPHRPSCS